MQPSFVCAGDAMSHPNSTADFTLKTQLSMLNASMRSKIAT